MSQSEEWKTAPEEATWKTHAMTLAIQGSNPTAIPIELSRWCAKRLRALRQQLRNDYVGLDDVIDWVLAALVARETVLLLGPPGVAKSELATRLFQLLDLKTPQAFKDSNPTLSPLPQGDIGALQSWWKDRKQAGQEQQKYFHYLLGRFTQPEELFGPIEISLLRQGLLVRVNFGFLTAPGVCAAFLDEVFKASSSILNTLLSIISERQYFNWGGMQESDLVFLIAASNELPGGLGTGAYGRGTGMEDFQTLYAFLDRFPIRLGVPTMSGADGKSHTGKSKLTEASELAIQREAARFASGQRFEPLGKSPVSLNDILLLGRACLQHRPHNPGPSLFRKDDLSAFETAFFKIADSLQAGGTRAEHFKITWTISPRKLKALYKIALAHALVCDDRFIAGQADVVSNPQAPEHLAVFKHIWDTPLVQTDLGRQVEQLINSMPSKR